MNEKSVADNIQRKLFKLENKPYSYILTTPAIINKFYLKIEFSVNNNSFHIITETPGVLIGRNGYDPNLRNSGIDIYKIVEDENFQVNIIRPAGQQFFETLHRHPGDVTRICLFGVKKLSRNHLFIQYIPGICFCITVIGTNETVVDEAKLVKMEKKELSNRSVILCNNLKIVISNI